MKNILIVVDMQNDFIDGALGTPEARAIVPAVAERIRKAREDGWRVIFTLDTHAEDYLETAEGKNLPVEHCVRFTGGWFLHTDILVQAAGCEMVEKPTFGSVALASMLFRETTDDEEEPHIELAGVCTDICVVSNALLLKATMPEAEIVVDSALCAGSTPEKHAAALDVMRSCQINVL